MGRIKDTNYYQVSGWMVNQLRLSGRELHVYAIIYGFTQDEETEFNGSISYMAEWLGTSNRNTVTRTINALIEKGLIEKRQETKNGVKINFYKAILPPPKQETPPKKGSTEMVLGSTIFEQGQYQNGTGGSTEMVLGGSTEMVLNNNIYNNINNNIDNLLGENPETEPLKSDPVPYEKIKFIYNNTCKHFAKIVSLSESRKRAIAARWKEYGGKLEAFEKLFTEAEASSFLKGANARDWTATFDWLLKSTNMAKVLEGNYRDKGAGANANRGTASTGATGSTSGNVRPPTTAELEEKLRREGTFSEYPDFDRIVAAHS